MYKEAMNRLRNMSQVLLLILGLVFLPAGCATTPKCQSQQVPEWLIKIPYDDTYFYAVGISGATRNVKDAWIQAGNRGRAELGRTIISHVSSKGTIISTSRGEYSRQIIDILSDTELNFTEIIQRWYDACGDYGSPKYYYVLIRMEKKIASDVLRRLQ
jgi:hypothetical protein